MNSRREFLFSALAAGVAGGRPLLANDKRRVSVAGFSHETNTFHPVRTDSFSFAEAGRSVPSVLRDSALTVVPGIQAYPNGGGTIAEKPCREAMDRLLDSLRAALPVDTVFLRCTERGTPRGSVRRRRSWWAKYARSWGPVSLLPALSICTATSRPGWPNGVTFSSA